MALISGKTFTASSQKASSGDIFENCTFQGIDKDALAGDGIANLTVRTCRFIDCGNGVYVHRSTNTQVLDCTVRNLDRIRGRGNFFQADKCTGGKILRNRGLMEPGKSNPEDLVSIYESSGFEVAYNVFRGGGPSASGGGLMCGENTNNPCDDNDIHDNVLVAPGHYGISIWGGSRNRLRNNRVYAHAAPNETWVAVGIQFGGGNPGTGNVIDGNQIDWRRANGAFDPIWIAKGSFTGTNTLKADLSALADIDPFTFPIDGTTPPPPPPDPTPPPPPTPGDLAALIQALNALTGRVVTLETLSLRALYRGENYKITP